MSIQRLSNAGQSGYRYKTLIAGITPVPSVPTIGTATALTYSTASVTFTAPGAYAGSTYTATSSPGGFTGTSASSPITVSGLSEQTAYTFTVTATNATGTSGASAASNSITTPAAWNPEGGYDALASVTLSASASSIVFGGIPSGYKHLELRSTHQSAVSAWVTLELNGDSTASNYVQHRLFGDGTGTGVGAFTSSNQNYFFTTYPYIGAGTWSFLDYSNTSKYKTIRGLSGWKNPSGTDGEVNVISNLWQNTSAITSIKISLASTTFNQYTKFALYGVK